MNIQTILAYFFRVNSGVACFDLYLLCIIIKNNFLLAITPTNFNDYINFINQKILPS